MIGREAYHHPWSMASWDKRFFADPPNALERDAVEAAMVDYMERRNARARRAVVAHRPAHDRAAQRRARRPPLAPGVVGPWPEGRIGAHRVAPGARRPGAVLRRA
jgi:hypothetical protein